MKYIQILIILLTMVNFNCKLRAQNQVEVNIHLNESVGSQSKFLLKYEFEGEGENAVKNTVFETILYVTLLSLKNDTFYYQIESESKKNSNIETLIDGEASILYTLFGISMKLSCDQKGNIIEIFNKGDINDELTINAKSSSNTGTKYWLENARKENETMLFESVYKLNYEALLKYSKMNKTIPIKMVVDSLIDKTLDMPESYIKTVEETLQSGKFFEFRKFIEINSKELLQKDELFETVIKPSKTTVSEILITNIKGLVERLTYDSKTVREGMVMNSNGKIMVDSESFTENLNVGYIRMEL